MSDEYVSPTEEQETAQSIENELPPVEQPKKNKMKPSDWVFIIVCVLLAASVLIFRFWWRNTYGGVFVQGSSMRETLQDGDELFMRYMQEDETLHRGDVIVVYTGDYSSSGKAEYIIKRLIAIEGDKVRCKDGQVEICYAGKTSFEPLAEPYAYYGTYRMEYDFAEYQVGENEIFFLGDNRSSLGSSKDSRYQEGLSGLTDRLYQEKDIYGIVPNWSIRHKNICKIFISNKK